MVTAFLLSCTGAPPSEDATDTAVPAEAPLEHQFSFVVIADPHVTQQDEHADRLEQAVAWINAEAPARGIELVFIVGDIGWGDPGAALAKELLDELDMPYLPVLGDNEVHFDTGATFEEVFGGHLAGLAATLPDFTRATVEAHNEQWNKTSWFQNFSFRYGGVRFVGLDWNSRDESGLLGEMADIHDFPGGTWPWFEAELTGLDPSDAEDVLMFSHHPMHLGPGAFDLAEMDRITGVTWPIEGRVAAAFAGHFHTSYEWPVDDGGYDVFVTDATWDDVNTIRVVDVQGNGARFAYVQELVVVPLLRHAP